MPDGRVVSIARCSDYERARVEASVAEALAPLGGMGAFVPSGARVLIKPNLLMKAEPSRAVTTHPEVLRAVVRAAFAAGASDVAVGDSPGGRATKAGVQAAMEAGGLSQVCSDEGARIAYFSEDTVRVATGEGALYASFNIAREVAETDVLIDLPKLKTHGFMMYTGAVKNLFGCIVGLEKAQFHLKVPDRDDFADMLVDLMLACKPALAIMDAVVAMEGDGPSGGPPRQVGAIIASSDPVALDLIATAMTGTDPMDVYTNRAAARRGLGPDTVDDVEVLGTDWRALEVADFAYPAQDAADRFPPRVRRWMRKHTSSRPYAEAPERCTRCKTCEKNCPVGAVVVEEGRPAFDYDACIRCYCCQELCPENVIALKTPALVRWAVAGGRGHSV